MDMKKSIQKQVYGKIMDYKFNGNFTDLLMKRCLDMFPHRREDIHNSVHFDDCLLVAKRLRMSDTMKIMGECLDDLHQAA